MRPDWKISKLSQVCEKITDGTHQTPTYFDKGFLFLSSKNVTSGKINWDEVRYIDNKQHLEMQRRVSPRLNDILLAKNGTTGVAAIVDRDITFDIYVSLALLRPLNAIHPKFLLHFINSPIAKRQFTKRLKGIGVPNLHLEEIREVEISYPESKTEQQRIVAILDEVFAAMRIATANAGKNIKNAREVFNNYRETSLAGSGANWSEKRFSDLCTISAGLVDPRLTQFIDLPHVGAGNMISGTGELVDIKSAREEGLKSGKFLFDDTMVLYSKIRPYLMKACLPDFHGLCSADVYPLLPIEGQMDKRFLFHVLMSQRFTDYRVSKPRSPLESNLRNAKCVA